MTQERTVTADEVLKGCNSTVPHSCLTAVHLGRAQIRYSVSNRYGKTLSLQTDAYVDMRVPAFDCPKPDLKI